MNSARFAAVLIAFIVALGSLSASDWPGFRGSHSGSSDDKELPGKLTSDNILWKIKLPGAGTSSPITTGDKLIVTCNTGSNTDVTTIKMGGGPGWPGGGGG